MTLESREDLQAESTMAALRKGLQALANPEHAEVHRAYHKSELRFYGLRWPQFEALFREILPRRTKIGRSFGISLAKLLWNSDWAEERWAALAVLERVQPELSSADLPLLKDIVHDCDGWGLTDNLSLRVLSPLALRCGVEIYRPVFGWLEDPHMWARRAGILVHILPGRSGQLNHEYAWPSLEARLFEKEFFIRKAIGWTLREIGKHYPEDVCRFLLRVGDRASGLTRREGARNLPQELRVLVLGK